MATDRYAAAPPTVVEARDERLRDATGRVYVDLCMGYGSVWLGHGHPAVTRAVAAQLDAYAAPGYLPTAVQEAARGALAAFLPQTHFVGGFYSTGMEAVETALRAARVHTGRVDIAGFSGSEHGRSFLTAAIGGTPVGGSPGFVHHLQPFTPDGLKVLERDLARLAGRVALAAIVVEPVQMTAGGWEITPASCEALFRIARERGICVIFDETLTGLHRCGPRFYADVAGVDPDILVLGKGLGNGFPCAAVALRKGFAWDREHVRPGSTFWNHPLACAAASATLDELSRLGAADRAHRDRDQRAARRSGTARSGRDVVPGLSGTRPSGHVCCAPARGGRGRELLRPLRSSAPAAHHCDRRAPGRLPNDPPRPCRYVRVT
jgi:acetylornithine/succinyldiaminopimelate/putrescine aminotransferase